MIAIDLLGRRALVTGANSGLGQPIALNLAAAGARVAVHALNDHASAEAVVRQIRQKSVDAIAVYGDVSQPEQVAGVFATVDKAFGGLDIMVNNAGIDGPREECVDSARERWHAVIDVDLKGSYYLYAGGAQAACFRSSAVSSSRSSRCTNS